jgi:hypothetical protein
MPADERPTGKPLTLRETCETLRGAHARYAYRGLRPYIDEEVRDELIDLLISLDVLLARNEAVQRAVRQSCPEADPARFDIAPAMADSIDLFARGFKFERAEIQGDQATVWARVRGEPPLVPLPFERRDGHWIYMPGPVPPEAVAMVRAATEGLDRIAAVLSRGPVTVDELENEYRYHFTYKVRKAAEAARTSVAAE